MLLFSIFARSQAYLLGLLASLLGPYGEDGPPEFSDPSDAQEAPDESDFYIKEIVAKGSGCSTPDKVTSVIGDDKRSFVLIYDDMTLENPNPKKKLVQDLYCNAAIKLHIPGGYQVALATVNTRGYVYLDEKIRAKQTSKYFFAGHPLSVEPHIDLEGPREGLYDFTDEVVFESLVWSACGEEQVFNVNSILNLNAKANPEGEALFSNDTTDGKFQQLLYWQFRACQP